MDNLEINSIKNNIVDETVTEKFKNFLDINLNDEIKISQYKNNFKYGSDTFYLAQFAIENHLNKGYLNIFNKDKKFEFFNNEITKKQISKNLSILDLCSGSGILGIILKTFFLNSRISFVEIQENFCKLIEKNIQKNMQKSMQKNIQEEFNIYNLSIEDFLKENSYTNSYDIVIANPPFWSESIGENSKNKNMHIAKKEIYSNTLDTIFNIVKNNKKNDTELYMVNKPENLQNILFLAKRYNINVKTMQFVHHNLNTPPGFVLLKFKKGSNEFLRILPPIFIQKNN